MRVKVVERETSAAEHVVVPAELLASPVYAGLRKSYARLQETVGRAAVHARARQEAGGRETFEELRDRALDLAKEGIQISRFKGLGEMNAEELWATTMDPAQAAAGPRRRRGRRRRRPGVLDADGRPGRAAPRSSSSRTRRT